MKLAVVFLVAFAFLGCQSQYYNSYNPRFMNPFFFSPWGSFNAPMARYNFFNEPQYNAVNYQSPLENYALQDSIGEDDSEQRIQPRLNHFNRAPNNNPVSPRFFLNYNPALVGYNNNNNGVVGPALLRTYLYTSIITTTVTSLSKCIPANQFSAGPGATTCIRRRRDIAEFLDKLILSDDGEDEAQLSEVKPSPVEKVEITAIPAITVAKNQAVSSSKDEAHGDVQDADFKRNKRFFNLFGLTSTITSYFFVTSTVPKQVSIVAQSVAGADVSCGAAKGYSCLACVPPGYGVC